jgi:hypothetical protein
MKENELRSLYAVLTLSLFIRVQLILRSLSHTFLDMLENNSSVNIDEVSLLQAIREAIWGNNINTAFFLFPTV